MVWFSIEGLFAGEIGMSASARKKRLWTSWILIDFGGSCEVSSKNRCRQYASHMCLSGFQLVKVRQTASWCQGLVGRVPGPCREVCQEHFKRCTIASKLHAPHLKLGFALRHAGLFCSLRVVEMDESCLRLSRKSYVDESKWAMSIFNVEGCTVWLNCFIGMSLHL